MSLKFHLFLLTCVVIVSVASADVFGDLFRFDLVSALTGGEDEDDDNTKREDDDSSSQSNCDCNGLKCNCCVDFNISSVMDLGGPGCVTMKYLSKAEGVALNVSYGDSVLHSQTVSDKNKKGTCMSLLGDFAQICARFAGLTETDEGLAGCLNFEPTVLGEITSQYHIGCFRMNPDGMFVDNAARNATSEPTTDEEGEEDEDDSTTEETPPVKPEEEAQSFMEAVNQSAEESLKFFSSLLNFGFETKKTEKNVTEATTVSPTEAPSRMHGKFGIFRNFV